MSTEVTVNIELIKALDAIPLTLRSGPFGRCLREFGKAIVPRAESLARSSRESGSRERWSKRFKNDPKFAAIDSKNHMSSKVTKLGSSVYVGAVHPTGNKQQFVMPIKKGDSYTQYRWGKPGQIVQRVSKRGKPFTARVGTKPGVARYPKEERATVKAFDQTKDAAAKAFLQQLEKEVRELKLG